ncbi:SDR family NAD(P)-dependent oxidoreductase [Yinghuangia sp. ASG 101]|uniref:SDR family NAD(P)-dependent oxidoreductase n=1 Tax=Yinghuangia sp. ASG 101 TaxID=2896848 RepID=UPI001E3329E1|nr:SDR family NAD(P)-dependent oxidoreductase [Yinghuangia sp. ASG 101]UGQ10875.1 SDR family NAD(P)-dependent oxidoreductase [Yinghuangia sp. ASG 101]
MTPEKTPQTPRPPQTTPRTAPDDAGTLPEGSVIVVAGAGGPAGQAAVARLGRAGAIIEAADADEKRLADAVALAPPGRAHGRVVDLSGPTATRAWAEDVERRHGRVDGVVHLVGGWRGGKEFGDNTADDWALLHNLLIRTAQNTSLAFHDALARAPRGRFVLVSATAAARPTAGNAGYAAAKAAAEAWTLAMADSFRRIRAESAPTEAADGPAAAILVVKALVWPALRTERPDAKFPGYTDVADLADEIATLWSRPTDDVNGRRLCPTQ